MDGGLGRKLGSLAVGSLVSFSWEGAEDVGYVGGPAVEGADYTWREGGVDGFFS